MKGVPKIVVIENTSEEAQPLADVLSKLGLPFVHFRGKAAGCLPETPLEGVRVLFLDFHLGGADGSGDKMIEASAIAHLEAVIGKGNGPWLLFTWTSRWQSNKDEFMAKVKKAGLFPASITVLEDKKALSAKPDELLAIITKTIKEIPAIFTLIEWEHAVAEAAVATVNRVFALSDGKIDDLADVKQRLSALARAELGEQSANVSGAERAAAAMRVLNGALADRIERRLPSGPEISVEDIADAVGNYAEVVNECLLFSQCPAKAQPIVKEPAATGDGTATILITETAGTTPDAQPTLSSIYANAVYDLPSDTLLAEMGLPKKNTIIEGWGKFKDTKPDRFADATKDSQLALIDVTPACDHAQPKPYLRVVVGFFVKADYKKWCSFPGYFTEFPPRFNLGATSPPMKLLVDTSLLISPPREMLTKLNPRCLLRTQLLTEIQYRISGNLSRSGLTFVE